jgi:hypothetical protein
MAGLIDTAQEVLRGIRSYRDSEADKVNALVNSQGEGATENLLSGAAKTVIGGLGTVPESAGRSIPMIPAGIGKMINAVPKEPYAGYSQNKSLDLASEGVTQFGRGLSQVRDRAMNVLGLKGAPTVENKPVKVAQPQNVSGTPNSVPKMQSGAGGSFANPTPAKKRGGGITKKVEKVVTPSPASTPSANPEVYAPGENNIQTVERGNGTGIYDINVSKDLATPDPTMTDPSKWWNSDEGTMRHRGLEAIDNARSPEELKAATDAYHNMEQGLGVKTTAPAQAKAYEGEGLYKTSAAEENRANIAAGVPQATAFGLKAHGNAALTNAAKDKEDKGMAQFEKQLDIASPSVGLDGKTKDPTVGLFRMALSDSPIHETYKPQAARLMRAFEDDYYKPFLQKNKIPDTLANKRKAARMFEKHLSPDL